MLGAFTTGAGAQAAGTSPTARVYERVSPVDKGGLNVSWYASSLSAPDGNTLIYQAQGPFGGNTSAFVSNVYRAVRGDQGWKTTDELPPMAPPNQASTMQFGFRDYTEDLSKGILRHTGSKLTDDAQVDNVNLYVRSTDGTTRLINKGEVPEPGLFFYPGYTASSADMSHVLYNSTTKLTPDAPDDGLDKLYEWVDGTLRLASVDPAGNPVSMAVAGVGYVNIPGAIGNSYSIARTISKDGRRVFFTALTSQYGSSGRLFVRQDGATTTEISLPQRPISGPDPDGTREARFFTATDDGSKAYFTSDEKLTEDSNACHDAGCPEGVATGPNLYSYDVTTNVLTDLTAAAPSAGAVSAVIDAAPDGRYVYFTSNARFADAPAFDTNPAYLYVWRDGEVKYISTLGVGQLTGGARDNIARISRDGRHLLYHTQVPNGVNNPPDNIPGAPPILSMYDYDAVTNTSTCVACPGGEQPDRSVDFSGGGGTAAIPMDNRPKSMYSADNSRVFFETATALVPADVNGRTDVYMFEGGKAHLISTGTSASDSHYMTTDRSGDNAFFTTRQSLVPSDTDTNVDVYVARIGGRAEQAATVVGTCVEDECQGSRTGIPAFARPAATSVGGGATSPVRARITLQPLTAAQRAQLAATGSATVKVKVTVGGRVTVTASGQIGKRRVVVAKATTTAPGAGTVRLTLKLSKTARAQLTKKRKLALTVSSTLDGAQSASRSTVTLQAIRTTKKASR